MSSKRMKQQSFFPPSRRDHGGSVHTGKRKEARPLDPRSPLHLVLRSSRARGKWSFLQPHHKRRIEHLLREEARKSGVVIYRLANVGNHLHLLLKARNRLAFQRFLRTASGRIAVLVTGARKGNPVGRFWDQLAYSRIVTWGRELQELQKYLIKNLFEAAGLWDRKKDPGRKFHHFSSA
ncbi:MAG: transposase [Methylotenera sp.]|nr:transposase [Oligoflexia bacterium]